MTQENFDRLNSISHEIAMLHTEWYAILKSCDHMDPYGEYNIDHEPDGDYCGICGKCVYER